ncbi:MAG: HisA/HisF-related TIM barrel protein [Actinomycetota bacterium]|nr:HisA/HisF-related TIM barrel protein [Actinomycetota bacterium]
MPFTVVPAIDVSEGRLGIATPDGPRRVEAFGGDPLTAAHAYADAGARLLHVVDMDRASGSPGDPGIITAIAAIPGIVAVQASGGVRSWEVARTLLGAGAARVVVSSSALGDEDVVRAIFASARRGEILVGIEVDEGRIRSRGDQAVDLDLASTLGWLQSSGAPGFLVTALARVGTETGPDLELIRRVTRAGLPTWAAGGVRSLEDLAAMRAAGAIGAVVGRAALDGAVDLPAALSWAAQL